MTIWPGAAMVLWRDALESTLVVRVRDAADVHELYDDATPRVHGVRDEAPPAACSSEWMPGVSRYPWPTALGCVPSVMISPALARWP